MPDPPSLPFRVEIGVLPARDTVPPGARAHGGPGSKLRLPDIGGETNGGLFGKSGTLENGRFGRNWL
jgi:hypothetical protein